MKIAVIGSGVSGLGATWLLNEHSDHEVHLYDADSRPGGHANTVRFIPPGKENNEWVDVDTGFIVFNPSTYPNFLRFLQRYPAIPILKTEMTFSVSRDNGAFEWAGSNLKTMFCQPSRLLDPNMWRLIYDVLRFNACARRLLAVSNKSNDFDDRSIGEYLDGEGYSDSFRDNYLIPMTAAIWSTPPDKCTMDFPAQTLIQFLHNHHLLQVTNKPSWLTIQGGSKVYVKSILSSLSKDHLHLSTPVKSLSTLPAATDCLPSVQLTTIDGLTTTYDHVILACHSDTALAILKAGNGVTENEQKILGRFRWSKNEAVLHSDVRLMPRSRLAWSCWNYLTSSVVNAQGKRKANEDRVALTYSMNNLQHICEEQHGPVLVTLNPPVEPLKAKTFCRFRYDHPVLDAQAVHSQKEMALIQGKRSISFAGAWLRYGFHEDGFTSGLRAVMDHIPDVQPPFDIQYAEREPGTALVALLFDVLERSCARAVLGIFLVFWLSLCRILLGFVLDLSHIVEEIAPKNKVD